MLRWNQFINGDCFELMPQLEERSVDLIFTSVPDLNDIGIKDIAIYETFLINTMNEFHRLINDTGFIAMCQTDRKINAQVYSKHSFIIRNMENLGFILKDYKIMVVNVVESKDQYKFPYQHLCVFTRKGTIQRKGDWLKHIAVYEMKKHIVGPYYVWNENFVKLVVENLSSVNDKVLDPFSGSGVVPYIACRMNRQYLGCEINKEIYEASLMNTAIV